MALILPDFHDPYLRELWACGHVRLDDPHWLPTRDSLETTYQIPDGPQAWIRFTVNDQQDGRRHFHFDVWRVPPVERPADVRVGTLEEIQGMVARFQGACVNVNIVSEYRIPMNVLPRRGLISSFLGIEAQACGSTLSLDGGSMRISGADTFCKLEWKCDADRQNVCVNLFGSSQSEVSDGYLTGIVETMHDGLECFVLEVQRLPGNPANAPDHHLGLRQADQA
jgi:hypothetical protein